MNPTQSVKNSNGNGAAYVSWRSLIGVLLTLVGLFLTTMVVARTIYVDDQNNQNDMIKERWKVHLEAEKTADDKIYMRLSRIEDKLDDLIASRQNARP